MAGVVNGTSDQEHAYTVAGADERGKDLEAKPEVENKVKTKLNQMNSGAADAAVAKLDE